jgi:hypothetical protein
MHVHRTDPVTHDARRIASTGADEISVFHKPLLVKGTNPLRLDVWPVFMTSQARLPPPVPRPPRPPVPRPPPEDDEILPPQPTSRIVNAIGRIGLEDMTSQFSVTAHRGERAPSDMPDFRFFHGRFTQNHEPISPRSRACMARRVELGSWHRIPSWVGASFSMFRFQDPFPLFPEA